MEDGELLVNEIAPRPHNSGHYSIEACATSQFEQHLRAILGWPLGNTQLATGGAIMVNILGSGEGADGMRDAHDVMRRAYEVSSGRLLTLRPVAPLENLPCEPAQYVGA